jgi:hypothetical protein
VCMANLMGVNQCWVFFWLFITMGEVGIWVPKSGVGLCFYCFSFICVIY